MGLFYLERNVTEDGAEAINATNSILRNILPPTHAMFTYFHRGWAMCVMASKKEIIFRIKWFSSGKIKEQSNERMNEVFRICHQIFPFLVYGKCIIEKQKGGPARFQSNVTYENYLLFIIILNRITIGIIFDGPG